MWKLLNNSGRFSKISWHENYTSFIAMRPLAMQYKLNIIKFICVLLISGELGRLHDPSGKGDRHKIS